MVLGNKLWIPILVAFGALVGGCLGDETDESTIECLEPRGNARGALLELRRMMSGEQPVDTTTIEGAATFMRQLGAQVAPPDSVLQDLQRWDAALGTWRNGLSQIEPRIENGRFVEPDTTDIDRRLLAELAPLAERLGAWVERACDAGR
jgi:hypothetical protein